jgi:S1-C subfamily serine protease
MRAGKERTATVTVGEWPEKSGKSTSRAGAQGEGSFGLTLETLTPEKARDLDYEGLTGVLVTEVKESSPAEDAGVRPGELITEANHQPIANLDDFSNALGKNKDKVLLLIRNKDGSRFVVLQTK